MNDIPSLQAIVDSGQFDQARNTINQWKTNPQLPEEVVYALDYEEARMDRIELDFSKSFDQIVSDVQRYLPEATASEISAWDSKGWLEYKFIEGEKKYFNRAGTNVFYIHEEIRNRLEHPKRFQADDAPLYQIHPHHQQVIKASLKEGITYSNKKKITITYSIDVKEGVIPAGEILKVWIPFPREISQRQENITLLSSIPQTYDLAPNSSLQRTIYLEQPAASSGPTHFEVTYSYDSFAMYANINPENVSLPTSSPELQPFLSERGPHIVFTPELQALSEKVVGDESNPYRIAQRLFEFVDSIPWASAREYSTIRNISQYASKAGHADCGQVTMLLITLMRMNGIPARWQSGWEFSDTSFDTMHDWGMFYLEPYGWMPMDVTHGKLSSPEEDISWFYLGGMDSYRLIVNDDFSKPFTPVKTYLRSETVDSQRGEVEWKEGNLYFNKWRYSMDWKVE